MVVGLANYYVLSFRSAPIMPWDLFSIGTALSVADNFKYTLEKKTIFVLLGFVVLIILEGIPNLRLKAEDKWKKPMIGVRIAGVFDFYRTIVQFYADAASRKHNP